MHSLTESSSYVCSAITPQAEALIGSSKSYNVLRLSKRIGVHVAYFLLSLLVLLSIA